MTAWLLPALVAAVAASYAAIGHAGATGYIAVMGLAGIAPEVIRPTALVLNIVVAAIATIQFARAGHFRRDIFLPLAVASAPAAAFGGAVRLPTVAFEILLGGVLAAAAVRIALASGSAAAAETTAGATRATPPAVALAAGGGVLGLVSGLTGVGGGVFLTPLLLAIRVAGTRQVAAVSAAFILVNSLAGLGGWLATGGGLAALDPLLVAAAAAGGLVGATVGAYRLPVRSLRLLVAAVLAVASVKLAGGAVAEWWGARSPSSGVPAAAGRNDPGRAPGRERPGAAAGPSGCGRPRSDLGSFDEGGVPPSPVESPTEPRHGRPSSGSSSRPAGCA